MAKTSFTTAYASSWVGCVEPTGAVDGGLAVVGGSVGDKVGLLVVGALVGGSVGGSVGDKVGLLVVGALVVGASVGVAEGELVDGGAVATATPTVRRSDVKSNLILGNTLDRLIV